MADEVEVIQTTAEQDVDITTEVAETKSQETKLKLVIAGAPACGKGTQCERLIHKFGVVHISTGEILRKAVEDGTEIGLTAKSHMDNGELVPDEVIIELVTQRLQEADCVERGWLLDGFPRTPTQADALIAAGIDADAVVVIELDDDKVVERATGRRLDPETGHIYHVTNNPPQSEEVAERLVHRSDDQEDIVRGRLETYHKNIAVILEKFGNKVHRVQGQHTPDSVFASVLNTLDSIIGSDAPAESEKADVEVEPEVVAEEQTADAEPEASEPEQTEATATEESIAEPEPEVATEAEPAPVVEPVAEEPAAAEPEPEEPVVAEPEPAAEEPAAAEPEPAAEEVVAEPESSTEEPAVAEPEPAAEEPVAGEPESAVEEPEVVAEPEPVVETTAEPEQKTEDRADATVAAETESKQEEAKIESDADKAAEEESETPTPAVALTVDTTPAKEGDDTEGKGETTEEDEATTGVKRPSVSPAAASPSADDSRSSLSKRRKSNSELPPVVQEPLLKPEEVKEAEATHTRAKSEVKGKNIAALQGKLGAGFVIPMGMPPGTSPRAKKADAEPDFPKPIDTHIAMDKPAVKKRRPPNLQAKAEKANELHGEIAEPVVAAIGADAGAAEAKRTPTAAAAQAKKSPKAKPATTAEAKAPEAQTTEGAKKKCIIS